MIIAASIPVLNLSRYHFQRFRLPPRPELRFFFPLFFIQRKVVNIFILHCAQSQPSPSSSENLSSTFLSSFLQVKERLYFPINLSIISTCAWHRIKRQFPLYTSPHFDLAHLCSGLLAIFSSYIISTNNRISLSKSKRGNVMVCNTTNTTTILYQSITALHCTLSYS